MAALNSTLYTLQVAHRAPKPGNGLANDPKFIQAIVAIPATGAGTAAGDTIGFFVLPKGSTLRKFMLQTDQLDSNGAATLAIDVGFTGTTNAFVAAWLGAKNAVAGVSPNLVEAKIGQYGFTPTVDTPIFATINVVAATKAAGTMVASMYYEDSGLPTS